MVISENARYWLEWQILVKQYRVLNYCPVCFATNARAENKFCTQQGHGELRPIAEYMEELVSGI